MVVPAGDAAAFAAAVRAVARDPAHLRAMESNARSLWQSRFRRADAMARWLTLIQASAHIGANPMD
jgi:glycosyltransferase involved in cell wall biosynthesis